jgi:hypothetical protein
LKYSPCREVERSWGDMGRPEKILDDGDPVAHLALDLRAL